MNPPKKTKAVSQAHAFDGEKSAQMFKDFMAATEEEVRIAALKNTAALILHELLEYERVKAIEAVAAYLEQENGDPFVAQARARRIRERFRR